MHIDSKRWIYLVICMIINICIGFIYAWSVFQIPLAKHFKWSISDVSLAFTIIMSVSALPQGFAGKALEFVEPKQVILAGGLMLGTGLSGIAFSSTLPLFYTASAVTGLGIGVVYPGTVSNMVKYFPDRRGLCSGLLSAGMGSGAVIIAPLAYLLIEHYGIISTFRILGSVFLVIISLFSRIIPTAPEDYKPAHILQKEKSTQKTVDNKNWRVMLKDPVFYFLAGIFIAGPTSGIMIMGHASPIAQDALQISAQTASFVVGFLALANTIGRVFWGWLSDRTGRYPVIFMLFILLGGAMISLSLLKSPAAFIPVLLTVPLCYGGFMGLMASLTADSFGTKYLGVNFGVMFLTIAIASFIGPRMAAVIKEANNNDYSPAFIIAACICAAGLILSLLAKTFSNKKHPDNSPKKYTQ